MASSSRLKPGETGKISFAVDTTGKSGRLTKTVEIRTNDPTNPSIGLSLTVIVK